jgi:hypothetical protein
MTNDTTIRPVQEISHAIADIKLTIATMHYVARKLKEVDGYGLITRAMLLNTSMLESTIHDLHRVMSVSQYEIIPVAEE